MRSDSLKSKKSRRSGMRLPGSEATKAGDGAINSVRAKFAAPARRHGSDLSNHPGTT
jgi:hypothetical protein